MGDGGDAVALVVVGAAEEDQGALAAAAYRADPARVAFDGRCREAGQVGDRELVLGDAEGVGCGDPPRTHDQRDVVVPLPSGELAEASGGGLGSGQGVGGDDR